MLFIYEAVNSLPFQGSDLTNLELIKELYENYKIRNLDRIRELFHPEIEWTQMPSFPNGGHYVGADAIFEHVFNGFRENWDGWQATVDDFLEVGTIVIATGYYQGTYKATGKSMQAEFAHWYTLSEGKVRSFKQYTDTYSVLEATLAD